MTHIRKHIQARRPLIDANIRHQALADIATEDLEGLIGRYCGPHNLLLCEKKFGIHFSPDDIQEEIIERTLFPADTTK